MGRPHNVYCSKRCAGLAKTPRRFDVTPDELERLVWSEPTQVIAERLGVSDVAVAKRCRELDIEKPPRGYWAKRVAGKTVARDGSVRNQIAWCACGCGDVMWKWRGAQAKPRQAINGHTIQHWAGTYDERLARRVSLTLRRALRREARRLRRWRASTGSRGPLDINVVARLQCRAAHLDDMSRAAVDVAEAFSERTFCEYVGVIWLAVREAWLEGVRCLDALLIAARRAVRASWRQGRGRARFSTDEMGDAFDWLPVYAQSYSEAPR